MLYRTGLPAWAQVGWYELSGGTRYTWREFINQPGHQFYDKFWSPAQPTESYTYYTVLYDGQGNVSFQVAGTTIESVVITWVPGSAATDGEIETLASQMPGSSSDHEVFYDTHLYENGAWEPFSGTQVNYDTNNFGTTYTQPYVASAWDRKCAS